MKRLNSGILLAGLGLAIITGCRSLPVMNKYHYVEATIKDIPRFNKVEGILVMAHYHPEMGEIIMVIGDQDKVEHIIGREIFPEKVASDPIWLRRIPRHYLEARRVNNFGRGSFNDSRVVFVTKKKAYMIPFGVDNENGNYTVYGDDYTSEELGKDFQELGLLDEEEPYNGIPSLEYFKRKMK
jgi:hypothetical protein